MKKTVGINLAGSILAIEEGKINLLSSVTELFRSMQGGKSHGADVLPDLLATVIIAVKNLSHRLGFEDDELSRHVKRLEERIR